MSITIGFDVGYTGGICIIDSNGNVSVYSMPVKIVKDKKKYNVLEICNILKKYQNEDVKIGIENVFTMPGQGISSSGNLLEGKGILIGLCTAIFNKDPLMISPMSWKKHFPDLTNSPETNEIKEQINKIKESSKLNKNNKSIKKDISKLNSKYKALVKTRTRVLAAERYPLLKDQFKLVKDDGKADALFISLYVRESSKFNSEDDINE